MEDNPLQGDIFKYEILKNLSLIDFIKLTQVNRYYHTTIDSRYIKEYICSVVTKRLKKIFGTLWGEFEEILNKTEALISGSFIIQSICEENWNTDIDIYLEQERAEILEQWLLNRNFIYYGTPASAYVGMITSAISEVIDYGFICEKNIEQFSKLKSSHTRISKIDLEEMRDCDKPKIQLIKVNRRSEELFSFISEDFDFDICKNGYHIKNNQPILEITALNQIVNRSTYFYFKSNADNGMTLQRYHKYKDRGFEFKNLQIDFNQTTIDKFSNASIITIEPDKSQTITLEPLTDIYRYVSGNKKYFSSKLNCLYFFIFNDSIIFNKDQLMRIDHTDCDICLIMKQITPNKNIYHISFDNRFMSLQFDYKPLELIFIEKED